MTPEALVEELTSAGISLSVVNDRIRYRPTPPPHLLAALKEHKPQVMAILAATAKGERTEPRHCVEASQADTNPKPQVSTPYTRCNAVIPAKEEHDAPGMTPPDDLSELVTERAAIMEYSGGLDRMSAEERAVRERGSCYLCGGGRFWVSRWGVIICERCHPPADHRIVERTIVLPGRRSSE